MIGAQWGMVTRMGMTNEILDSDQWLRLTAIYESRVLTAVGGSHTPCRAWGRALGSRVHMRGRGRQALEEQGGRYPWSPREGEVVCLNDCTGWWGPQAHYPWLSPHCAYSPDGKGV